jgi:hypothetical protein
MKTILRFLALAALGLHALHAGANPTTGVKQPSAFTMEAKERNPFWPIGWKPSANTAEKTGPDIPVTAFLVSSITLDPNAHFAIINGKTMKEGQQFGLQMGNQTYQITLKAIEDGRVILQRRDEEIIVPLRRK